MKYALLALLIPLISFASGDIEKENQIVDFLSYCESRHNSRAINPKDSDGTASWGRLQFKIGTLKSFGVLYGLLKESDNAWDYRFDSMLQENILRRMIRNKVNLANQFPACWKRYLNGARVPDENRF